METSYLLLSPQAFSKIDIDKNVNHRYKYSKEHWKVQTFAKADKSSKSRRKLIYLQQLRLQ